MAENQCGPAPRVAGLILYAKDLAPCGSYSHGSKPMLCMHGCTIHQGMESTGVECSGLWCATMVHTSKGEVILLSFPPFPRNGGTDV